MFPCHRSHVSSLFVGPVFPVVSFEVITTEEVETSIVLRIVSPLDHKGYVVVLWCDEKRATEVLR